MSTDDKLTKILIASGSQLPPCDYCVEHNLDKSNGCGCWTQISKAKASINKEALKVALEIIPKSYKHKVGLDVAQLWDSQDATDGYNQALKDVIKAFEDRYKNEE